MAKKPYDEHISPALSPLKITDSIPEELKVNIAELITNSFHFNSTLTSLMEKIVVNNHGISQSIAPMMAKIALNSFRINNVLATQLAGLNESIANIAINLAIPKIDYSKFIAPAMAMYSLKLEEVQKNLLKSFININFNNLAQIRAHPLLLNSNLDFIKGLKSYNDSFAIKLAEILARSFELNVQNTEEIQEFVRKEVRRQPNAAAIYNTIMAILAAAAVYFAYLQWQESKKSSIDLEKKSEVIFNLLKEISTKLDIKPDDDLPTHFVERRVQIKIKPDFKSSTIAVVYRNQTIRLVKSKHKWLYIEYFDYLEGIPKYGWANKKYLAKIS